MKVGKNYHNYLKNLRKNRGNSQGFTHNDFFVVYSGSPERIKLTRSKIGVKEAPKFRRQLIDYLSRYEGDLVIDAKKLEDTDYAGLAVIVEAISIERSRGYGLLMQNINSQVEKVIKLAKLERLIGSEQVTLK